MKKAKRSGWRSRIVGHGTVNPETILKNPDNYKSHPDEQNNLLSKAIEKVGFVRSVTISKRSGMLIDGHARVALAIRRKEKQIDVEYLDLTPSEEKIVLASMDPIAALADMDQGRLDELIDSISTPDAEIDSLLESLRSEQQTPMVKTIEVKEPPLMAYVLIGIELSRFSKIADQIEKLGQIPGVYTESTLSDESPKTNR